jgi:hypothetical protein
MNITLVPHIPDDLVMGAIKHPMQGYGKLNNTKIGSQMPPGSGYCSYDFIPELTSQFIQLRD